MARKQEPGQALPKDPRKLEEQLREAIETARTTMSWDEILRVVAECSVDDPDRSVSGRKRKRRP